MAERIGIEKVAEMTGYSIGHLQRLIREGKGPRHIKLGRKYFFFEKDIEEWIMGHMVEPKE